MAESMQQPFPLDLDDDLDFSLEDEMFGAGGEQLASADHQYEGGSGLEVYGKTIEGAKVKYRARFIDETLADGAVRYVTFKLVGNGTPPLRRDRSVAFVVQRSTSLAR